jgi:hypothetical protein
MPQLEPCPPLVEFRDITSLFIIKYNLGLAIRVVVSTHLVVVSTRLTNLVKKYVIITS